MKFNDYFKLKDITVNVTNSCNLNCVYCFEHNKNGMKMSSEMIEKIIDVSYNNYLITNETKFPFVVNFFGGEPFLAFDVMEHAMKYAKNKKYRISFGVTTNLTMLTDHMIDVIEDYELGLLVSVDGIKKIHDRNRCNSYDTVMSNLNKLIDRGLKHLVEVRMTVMPADLKDLLTGIQELYNMGIDNIAPVPVTDIKWTDADYMNLRDEMHKIWEWAFSIYNDENNKRNLSLKCIDDYLEMVLNPIFLVPDQRKVCTAGTFSSCSFGVTGDILPCHQRHTISDHYDELVMGNINNTDEIREVNFNKQTIMNENHNCDVCNARAVCKGGCPSENLTLNNDGNVMNDVQCNVLAYMVDVAEQFQWYLINDKIPNIRSRKLNILSQNVKLLDHITDILLNERSIRENEIELLKFYEALVDMEGILLPSFREAINYTISQMVNIIDEQIKNEGI